VEIGTGRGALTLVFGLWGLRLGIPVLTVDINPDLSKPIHHVFEKLGIKSVWEDEWETKEIEFFIDGRKVYMYCDGGDKPRELNHWHDKLMSGSMISVHDWGVEIRPEDVPEVLIPHHPERWLNFNQLVATWKVP